MSAPTPYVEIHDASLADGASVSLSEIDWEGADKGEISFQFTEPASGSVTGSVKIIDAERASDSPTHETDNQAFAITVTPTSGSTETTVLNTRNFQSKIKIENDSGVTLGVVVRKRAGR